MFPPIDDAVLENNPDFANLYKTLTTVILNPNGSTKEDAGAKEREAVREELDAYRLKYAKQQLLLHALSTCIPPEPRSSGARQQQIPQHHHRRARSQHQHQPQPPARDPSAPSSAEDETAELHSLLVLLPPLLAVPAPPTLTNNPQALTQLLSSPPLSKLSTYLPRLASDVLAPHIQQRMALPLARILHPTTNASFLHRHVGQLASEAQALRMQVEGSGTTNGGNGNDEGGPGAGEGGASDLVARRAAAVAKVLSSLDSSSAAVAGYLRALEGRHGTVARGTEARVSEVVLRARLGEADAEMALWLARRGILFGGGSGGNAAAMAEVEATGRALRKYRAELTVRRREADAEVVRLKELLREYGVVVDGAPSRIGVPLPQGGRDTNPAAAMGSRERTMREMARVKRDLQQRIREARADVDQLTREQRR